MWHVLKAELAYSRPYLLGGLGLAAGVGLMITVIFAAVGEDGPPPQKADGIRIMFLVMAPLIVSFIVQAYRSEERRLRLLMMLPLTPRQLAGVTVLLPTIFFGVGILAAGLVMGAGALVRGKFELDTFNLVAFVGGQIFAYVQMGLLAQEATAASRQRRRKAAIGAWAGFGIAVVLLASLYLISAGGRLGSLTWGLLGLGHLVVALAVIGPTVAIFAGRTDFTR